MITVTDEQIKAIKLQIGDKLKEIRTRTHISKQDLSYHAHVDKTVISNVEAGDKGYTVDTFLRLVLALEGIVNLQG